VTTDERSGAEESPGEDLGEPIDELKALEVEVSSGFLARLVSALQRRSLVGQMATLAWIASAQAILEFLSMIFSIFDSGPSRKEEDRTNG
jgi:hypothetical protein